MGLNAQNRVGTSNAGLAIWLYMRTLDDSERTSDLASSRLSVLFTVGLSRLLRVIGQRAFKSSFLEFLQFHPIVMCR
jgi:hypothetical protein